MVLYIGVDAHRNGIMPAVAAVALGLMYCLISSDTPF